MLLSTAARTATATPEVPASNRLEMALLPLVDEPAADEPDAADVDVLATEVAVVLGLEATLEDAADPGLAAVAAVAAVVVGKVGPVPRS